MFIKITESPKVHKIIRKLIGTQKYEIELMDEFFKKEILNVTSRIQKKKLKKYFFLHIKILNGIIEAICHYLAV